MIETIAQVFGMVFVGIILICIVWTFLSYIVLSNEEPKLKGNKKLMDNMNKLDKR